MQILLTNDDGIHAPGLAALRDALAGLGPVQVVAPALEQSGVGLSITYLHPLMVREELREGRQPVDGHGRELLERVDPPAEEHALTLPVEVEAGREVDRQRQLVRQRITGLGDEDVAPLARDGDLDAGGGGELG